MQAMCVPHHCLTPAGSADKAKSQSHLVLTLLVLVQQHGKCGTQYVSRRTLQSSMFSPGAYVPIGQILQVPWPVVLP